MVNDHTTDCFRYSEVNDIIRKHPGVKYDPL